MLLMAGMPDRLHAEILGPMGAPRLILDAGSGVVAVVLVGERTAYRGEVLPGESLDFLGLDVTLPDLVGALVTGRRGPDVPGFRRVPETAEGLPEEFEIHTPSGSLRLTRLRFIRGDPATSLGTGAVPGGFRVLPLDELAAKGRVLLEAAGGEGSP